MPTMAERALADQESLADRALDLPSEEAQQLLKLEQTKNRQLMSDAGRFMTAFGVGGIPGAVGGAALQAGSTFRTWQGAMDAAAKAFGAEEQAAQAVDAAAGPGSLPVRTTSMPTPTPTPTPAPRPPGPVDMGVDEIPVEFPGPEFGEKMEKWKKVSDPLTQTSMGPTAGNPQMLDDELRAAEIATDAARAKTAAGMAARRAVPASGMSALGPIGAAAGLIGLAFEDIGSAGDLETDLRHMSMRSGPASGPITPGTLNQEAVGRLGQDPALAKRLYDDGVLSHALYTSLAGGQT